MTQRPDETGEPVEPVTAEDGAPQDPAGTPASAGSPPAGGDDPDRQAPEPADPGSTDPTAPGAPVTGETDPDPGVGDPVVPQPDPDALTEVTPGTEPPEAPADGSEEDEVTRLRSELEERTADLKRLQAEFVNYKRRVERDRELLEENATYKVLTPIIEVLDTIDRAREHGELESGLKAVAEQLERTVTNLGLTKFGEAGDPFDPELHEALSHTGEDPDVKVTTCSVVAKAGYRIGDRVVRAAQVLVVDPPE